MVAQGYKKEWTPLPVTPKCFKYLPHTRGNVLIFVQRNVNASGVIPQLSLIMGPCAGGFIACLFVGR